MAEERRLILRCGGASAAIIWNRPENLPAASAYPDMIWELRFWVETGLVTVAQVCLLQNRGGRTDVRALMMLICRVAHKAGIHYLIGLVKPDDADRDYSKIGRVVMDYGIRPWDFADGKEAVPVAFGLRELYDRYLKKPRGGDGL